MASVGFFATDVSKGFYGKGTTEHGPSGPHYRGELRRKSRRYAVFLLCEYALQPAVQSSALGLLRAASAGHSVDWQMAASLTLGIANTCVALLKAAAEWRSLRSLAQESLSAGRSVQTNRPNSPQPADNLVDGTPSEWLIMKPEPVWIDVACEEVDRVEEVWVQWWGTYGRLTDLGVFSMGPGQGPDNKVHRGTRVEDIQELNGWTRLKGWDGPTSVVRFELSKPHGDCFNNPPKFNYGLRQLVVTGPLRMDAVFIMGLASFVFAAALLLWSVIKTYAAVFHCTEGLYNIGAGCVPIDLSE